MKRCDKIMKNEVNNRVDLGTQSFDHGDRIQYCNRIDIVNDNDDMGKQSCRSM